MKRIHSYLKEIEDSVSGCEKDIDSIVSLLDKLKKQRGRVWVLGNGGSMAIAQHFAQDLLKMRNLRAHVLNCPSVITAYSNDDMFENAFYSPLLILKEEGDVIFIFSCSGRSKNYAEFVSRSSSPIVSVVGTDGGFLKDRSDICVHVKSKNYQVCETAFSLIADLINLGLGETENA